MQTTSATRSGRLFAAWYPALMPRIDRNARAAIRRRQLAAASGRVREIGVGSELSMPHCPAD